MSRFYFLLWWHWAVRVSICSVVLAVLISGVGTLFIYFSQGSKTLNEELLLALGDIFIFWFAIIWNLTLLIALFRSLKYIFYRCYAGYKIELFSCQKEKIFDVGYGDLIKLWRKWIMLMIWLVGVEMVFSLVITKILSLENVFDWFNIYFLFGFILAAGYFSFVLLSARCKQVKVVKC